jgi:2-C-methyl-D-erythritol 4-phosphate cytidylyltransferase
VAIALIVAAGRGERLGTSRPKAFATVGGRPMLAWSIDAFRSESRIREVVVALPVGFVPADPSEQAALEGCVTCDGGAERSLSVRNALQAARSGPEDEAVLVHDAARPMLDADLIGRLIDSISMQDGPECAVAAVPVSDTIRVADGDGRVVATPERSSLFAMQTPQAFSRGVLDKALSQDDDVLALATDDAALVEAQGGRIELIRSSPENFKVTNPIDLKLAAMILDSRGGSAV